MPPSRPPTSSSSNRKKNKGKKKRDAQRPPVDGPPAPSAGLGSRPEQAIVEGVRGGDLLLTVTAEVELDKANDDGSQNSSRWLIEDGLIEALLGLLERCKDEEFDSVLADVGNGSRECLLFRSSTWFLSFSNAILSTITGIKEWEDSLTTPSWWVMLLAKTIASSSALDGEKMDECRLRIASGIEQLVECMVGAKREFYKSNKHWHCGIADFMDLLANLAQTKGAVNALLKYDGILDLLVQCLFWEEHRKDIVEESWVQMAFVTVHQGKACSCLWDPFDFIATKASFVLVRVIGTIEWRRITDGNLLKEEKRTLELLARTPIVCQAYSADNDTIFAVGLTGILRSQTAPSYCKDVALLILKTFAYADLVDKTIIENMVEHGRSIDSCDRATQLMFTLFIMVTRDKRVPSDSRIATAVGAGLLEVCLSIILRLGGGDGVFIRTCQLLEAVDATALMKKTSDAISNRRESICNALEIAEGSSHMTDECELIVCIIRSFVEINPGEDSGQSSKTASCFCCHKSLEKHSIRYCSNCNTAMYCSEEVRYALGCLFTYWHRSGVHFNCNTTRKYSVKRRTGEAADTSDGVTKCEARRERG